MPAPAKAQSAAFWSNFRNVTEWNKDPADKTFTSFPKVTLESLFSLFSRELFCQVVTRFFPQNSENYDRAYLYWMEHHAEDYESKGAHIPPLSLEQLLPLIPRKAFCIFAMAFSHEMPEYDICMDFYAHHHADQDDAYFNEACKNLVPGGHPSWDSYPRYFEWRYEGEEDKGPSPLTQPAWDLIPVGTTAVPTTWWYSEDGQVFLKEWHTQPAISSA